MFIEERTVDVHIKRLREALAPAQCAGMVDTVRGAGYRLTRHFSAQASADAGTGSADSLKPGTAAVVATAAGLGCG